MGAKLNINNTVDLVFAKSFEVYEYCFNLQNTYIKAFPPSFQSGPETVI